MGRSGASDVKERTKKKESQKSRMGGKVSARENYGTLTEKKPVSSWVARASAKHEEA